MSTLGRAAVVPTVTPRWVYQLAGNSGDDEVWKTQPGLLPLPQCFLLGPWPEWPRWGHSTHPSDTPW